MLHKNEEKTEQNSASFRKPTSIERGLRPNGYFPLMRQPLDKAEKNVEQRRSRRRLQEVGGVIFIPHCPKSPRSPRRI